MIVFSLLPVTAMSSVYGQSISARSAIMVTSSSDINQILAEDIPELKEIEADNLIHFRADYLNGSIYLNWKAWGESEKTLFLIERSYDNQEFFQIGYKETFSANPGLVLGHSWEDRDLPQDVVYYRIGKVYLDGRYYYGKTIEVKIEQPKFTETSLTTGI